MTEASWRHLDLFCGPGGFATGFEAAGFSTVAGIDIHKPSVLTFKANHPEARVFAEDIRDLSIGEMLGGTSENVHVVTAGVPCEGFSMANRNRNRFVDERTFLFLELLRVAESLKPPYIVLENVAALSHHSNGFFSDEITRGMQELGYLVERRVLNALDYGVPQRRRRLFFIGRRPGWGFNWPDATHGISAAHKAHVTVWEAIGDLPPLENGEVATEYSSGPVSEYAKRMRGASKDLLNHFAGTCKEETVKRIARTKQGEPMYPSYKQRIRLDAELPCPTLVSGGIRPQFHYGHPTQPRGLSIRERARIMSFPDCYVFEGGLVQGRVQTGDAVPPLLAEAVAKQIGIGLEAGPVCKVLPVERLERVEQLTVMVD